MTTQDYQLVALSIKETLDEPTANVNTARAMRRFAAHFANAAVLDNDRFDRDIFYEAAFE